MTILELSSCILLTLSILGLGRTLWWFSILDFFRLQYACLALLLLCISLFYFDPLAIGCNIASIALNFFRIRHFLPKFSETSIYQNKDILSLNAFKDNANIDELSTVIKGSNPHVMLIMEMTDDKEHALRKVLRLYPHRLETPVRDGFRICLFSKHPLEQTNITYHGPSQTPLLRAQIEMNDELYQFFCAHPRPALNKDWHKARSAYFEEVAPIIARSDLPTIVLGDFNAVPWGIEFQEFLAKTNLQSTLNGWGYNMTWPVFFPFLGIPMDHILISKGEDIKSLHVGPYAGSDHYPVAINL